MRRSIPLCVWLGLFCSIFVLFAPRASAQNGVVCWAVSYEYRNETAAPGSVTLTLEDVPLVFSYTATETLQPGEDRFVSIHGYVTAGTGVSSQATSPTLTFVGFGDFGEVPDSVCGVVAKTVPSLGLYGLMLLAGLLAGLGVLGLGRR